MSGAHRPTRGRRLTGRIAGLGIAAAVVAALSAPGVALALFTSTPSARTASVTAATIGPPTGFTATATGSASANLSWTAPPNLTGYTLSQSPGTLAGCSAAPSAATTSCTATGLSPGTPYTWTLTAVYNNWASTAAHASASTFHVVGTNLQASATDGTAGTQTTTVSNVASASGATLLILAYRQGSTGNMAISSITGTAITSGTAASVNSQAFNSSGGGKFGVLAWQATGTGTTNGTVVVKFAAANNVTTTIDVIQLSGNNTATPIAGSAVSTASSGTTVTGGALSPGTSSDGEIFFAGLSASTSMSTPSGYAKLDVPASTVHGAWFSSSASASGVATSLGASGAWGTIEIEISHG